MNCGRCYWSGLLVCASRSHAYERSLFVQTEPSVRFVSCSSVGTVVRGIHGKLNCADPCRLGLSRIFQKALVVSVDQSQSNGKDWMTAGYPVSKNDRVEGADAIRDKDREAVRPAG